MRGRRCCRILGYELVRRAAAAGIAVQAIPGPLRDYRRARVAGLPTDRFCFEGFLPARERERRAALAAGGGVTHAGLLRSAASTSRHARDMAAAFGAERPAAVARELTKVHETVYRGTLAELAQRAADEANFTRGEITVVVQGAPRRGGRARSRQQLDARGRCCLQELPPGKAAALAAQLTGATRNDAYALA